MTLGLVVYNAIESRNTRVAITKRTRDKIIVTPPTPIRLIRNNLFIIQFCCSMTAQAASLETVIWFMVVAVTNLMHSQCHISYGTLQNAGTSDVHYHGLKPDPA